MEDVKNWLDSTVASNDQLKEIKNQINTKANDAFEKAKTGYVIMENATAEHVQEAQSTVTQLAETYHKYEEIFFHHLKAGVNYAVESPGYTTATVATLAIFSYKGPRRFLYRNTFGRFISEETEILAAERKVKDLKTSLDVYGLDNKKLQERAEAAKAEFVTGRIKLSATTGELQRLWKNIYKSESSALKLKESLRELPTRESIRLRAEVASLLSAARTQKSQVDKQITQISKLGVS